MEEVNEKIVHEVKNKEDVQSTTSSNKAAKETPRKEEPKQKPKPKEEPQPVKEEPPKEPEQQETDLDAGSAQEPDTEDETKGKLRQRPVTCHGS